MSLRERPVALGLAVLIALVGATLAIRAVLPSRASPSPISQDSAAHESYGPDAPPAFSLPADPGFETQVTPESLSVVASSVRERSATAIRDNSTVAGLGADATAKLLDAVEEQFPIYFGASYDDYVAFLERTGAGHPVLDKARATGDAARLEQAHKEMRGFWEAVTAPIAFHPISLEEVTVRLRYQNGRPTRSADDRYATAINTSSDRWPALAGDPEVNPYTIVEWIVPVYYVLPPDVQTPAYFAIWFIWDPQAKDWRIHQTRMYSPLRQTLTVVPSL